MMGTKGRSWSGSGITIVVILALYGQAAEAQVKTDIRTDGSLGAKVALPGPRAEIPASLGRRAGKNLFHSFARFNVGTGESATFTGPGGLDNVISRVTGGERSAIDGRLASKIPGADFWFINPAGLAFGPNASLDVPASFHVSTADELRFPGGEVFSATELAKSVLSVASPEAFGFLGAKPAPITVEVGAGKALGLSSPGETLSFTGGDITITGGQGSTISSNGDFFSPGGEIDVVSLASAGEVRLPGATTDASKLGSVHIKGPPPVGNLSQFQIQSLGVGGGTIRIRGGQVVAEDVALGTLNLGGTDATGGIFIKADEVVLGGANYILTNSVSDKLPAKLTIEAKSLRMTGTGGIGTFGTVGAPSGDVVIDADTIEIFGTAGNLGILAATITEAAGGTISIKARDSLSIGSGVIISSSALAGTGPGGPIMIHADKELTVRDGALITAGAEKASSGKAGDITVTGKVIRLENGGQITSVAAGSGPGGLILVVAADQILMSNGSISATTHGTAKAGQVGIASLGEILMSNESVISVETLGTGGAGDVVIVAPRFSVNNSSIGASGAGNGDAGNVLIWARDKIVLDDARITTFARSESAQGGGIRLEGADSTRLSPALMQLKGTPDLIYLKDSEVTSEVFGDRGTTAGDINITADMLVQNNSRILARATAGRGGNIRIIADNLVVSRDSAIDASSERGIDGTLVVSTPEADVTSGLVVLPAAFLDAASRLRDSCAVRGAAEASRFSRAARTLPPGPGDPQVVSYASAADAEAGAAAETDTFAEAPGVLTIACGPPRP